MNLEIATARPEQAHACKACRWDWLSEGEPPAHTCRTPPSAPQATLAERARVSASILCDRELRIRRERLAELGRARG